MGKDHKIFYAKLVMEIRVRVKFRAPCALNVRPASGF